MNTAASQGPIELFVETYDGGPAREPNEIVKLCLGLDRRIFFPPNCNRQRTAWVDDRAFSVHHTQTCVPQPTPGNTSYVDAGGFSVTDSITISDPTSLRSCSIPVQNFRPYLNPLAASELFECLSQKQFDHKCLPDADRRLIYIADLNPHYILALTETAPVHQRLALKDALEKHVTLQTSIGVDFPDQYPSVYQLEMHIPYFAFRVGRPKEEFRRHPLNRQWRDLTFLNSLEETVGIYEAQISVLICGSEERRWNAYGFEDTFFDEDRQMGEDEFSYDGMMTDQIGSAGGEDVINANDPIWNPREYFLKTCSRRMVQAYGESQNAVRAVEKRVTVALCRIPSLVQHCTNRTERNEGMMKSFELTQKLQELLQVLLDGLSKTVSSWEVFDGPGGDIAYFSDMQHANMVTKESVRNSVLRIRKSVERFKSLQSSLISMQDKCDKRAQELQLQLNFESNNTSQSSMWHTELTLMIASPFAIACTFFGIPDQNLAFQRNAWTFTTSVLLMAVIFQLLHFYNSGRLRKYLRGSSEPTAKSEPTGSWLACFASGVRFCKSRTFRAQPSDSCEIVPGGDIVLEDLSHIP
ncbi:hypothetical protein EJ04DRAFT_600899 [Polyplosphaeria fusca]|uniref:Uncharacterized protein n=1 Tax=Polyplosphaeria fusca TaxID=682080 RepID=A0A9P4RBV3_9PLEO|nr:hypothetical protein EJ04DRAFT_600899 [Polyplosphaeria fusca]